MVNIVKLGNLNSLLVQTIGLKNGQFDADDLEVSPQMSTGGTEETEVKEDHGKDKKPLISSMFFLVCVCVECVD